MNLFMFGMGTLKYCFFTRSSCRCIQHRKGMIFNNVAAGIMTPIP